MLGVLHIILVILIVLTILLGTFVIAAKVVEEEPFLKLVALFVIITTCFLVPALYIYSDYLQVRKQCFVDKSTEACSSLIVDYGENPQLVNPDIKVRLENVER